MRTYRSFGFVLTMAAAFLVADGPAQAACTWSFNWYCSSAGCSRTMGRSTGTVDGFASEAACNSARGNWRSKGVDTTGSCNRVGICDSPAAAPSGAPPGGQGGGAISPTIPGSDDGSAERETEAKRENAVLYYNELAIDAANRKDWKGTVSNLERALQYDPHNPTLQDSLRRARKRLEESQAATAPPPPTPEVKAPPGPVPAMQPNPPATEKATADVAIALERRVDKIQVPPPMCKDDVAFDYGKDNLDTKLLEDFLTRMEWVSDGAEVLGFARSFAVGPLEITLPGAVLLGSKVLLAGQKGAEAYVLKKNEATDRALDYLKKEGPSGEFSRLVHALRTKQKVLPGPYPPEMIEAAKAILDKHNAESNSDITAALTLLNTPEARLAMLNKASMEIGGKLLTAVLTKKASETVLKEGLSNLTDEQLKGAIRWAQVDNVKTIQLPSEIDTTAVKRALRALENAELHGARAEAVQKALSVLKGGEKALVMPEVLADAGRVASIKQSMAKAQAIIAKSYAASVTSAAQVGVEKLAAPGIERAVKFFGCPGKK